MKSVIAALGIGVFASLVLFWLMQVMIMPEDKSVTKTISLNKMDFVRLKHEQPPKEKPKPPEKPKQPEPVQSAKKPQPPKKVQSPVKAKPKIQPQKAVQKPVPDLDIPKLDVAAPTKGSGEPQVSVPKASTNQGSGEGIDTSPASGKDKGNGSGMGQGTGNGINSGVIALVRIPPKYPKRAASRGIQGWVKIEFTITSAGTVKDAVVVDAKPGNIFDEAALDAISKWKFKEKIVNGVAVEQRAVQVLQFKLK